MAIQYNPDGTISSFGGMGSGPATYGSSPMSSMGGGGFSSPSFMSMNDSIFTPRTLSVTRRDGGGGGTGMANNLISSMQTAGDQQKNDSLAQYKALLAAVANTRKGVEGQFDQLGQSGLNDINMQQQKALGGLNQNLVSRGLGNTTIANSMTNGINRNATMERQNLQSGIAGQKIGSLMGLGQMQGDAILSRQNVGPDMGMYLQLISQLAGR